MFVGYAKKYGQPNPLNEIFLYRVVSIDKKDYAALLTTFFQVYNPAKGADASGLLMKYKVSSWCIYSDLSCICIISISLINIGKRGGNVCAAFEEISVIEPT